MTDVTQNQETPALPATPAVPAQQPTTDGANSGQSNGAKFTQEQINEIVGKTRKEARETAIAEMLKELGLASKDEVKSAIEDARKRKEADMTEADRAKALLDKVAQEKTSLETQLNAERAERRQDRIEQHLRSEAGKLKAPDVDTVLMYARQTHKGEVDGLLGDDGVFDTKKGAALLDKIKTEKPHYFASFLPGAGSPSNQGGRTQPLSLKADLSKFRI